MIAIPLQRRLWLASLALFAVLCVFGCDRKKRTSGSKAASSASAAASASAGPALATPCAEYAKRLCDSAGTESSACQSVNVTVALLSPVACKAALKDVDYSVKQLSKQRKPCEELVTKICKELGPKTQTCTMVTEQTRQFPPDRCAMMLEHMAEILVDLKKMEQANQPLAAELQAALKTGPAPSFGPAEAKVTVVEFSDFQCPYCAQAAKVTDQIRDKHGKEVRLIFRQFPLSIHAQARLAAEASLAANAQGKFWEYHDRLFENAGDLSREALEGHAAKLGLNMAAFKKALDDKTFAAAVEADLALGEKVQVQGTPTLFINGERVANPGSFEAVSTQIQTALK